MKRSDQPVRWFESLFDVIPDVFFRYRFASPLGFEYVSPAVEVITGYPASAFYSDASFCVRLISRRDRALLRQMVLGRKTVRCAMHISACTGEVICLELRTVPVVRNGEVLALEGVARLVGGLDAAGAAEAQAAPVQRRLAALLCEVHDLLQGHPELRHSQDLPRLPADAGAALLSVGSISLDSARMVVTLSGRTVPLTSMEVLVLRYFLERPNRVVSRERLLTDV